MGCGASKAYRVEAVPVAVRASFDDRRTGTFLAPIHQREATVDAMIDAAIQEDRLLASIDEMEQRMRTVEGGVPLCT